MSFARVLTESGLSKAELATMYGVSRQTVYAWSGDSPPRAGTLLARQAEVITQALETAIDKQLLPLGAMDKEMRRLRVVRMAARLQGLKPAPKL